jgi:hypothetical protein
MVARDGQFERQPADLSAHFEIRNYCGKAIAIDVCGVLLIFS